jgi:hypothetical protein
MYHHYDATTYSASCSPYTFSLHLLEAAISAMTAAFFQVRFTVCSVMFKKSSSLTGPRRLES